jgi:hypothetical protein
MVVADRGGAGGGGATVRGEPATELTGCTRWFRQP